GHANTTSTTIGNNNSGGGLRRASTQPETSSAGKAALGRRGPNRRRASVGKAGGGALGLKEFMHRTRVLGLYRGILKRARTLGDKDVADDARRQFRSSRDEADPLKLQMLMADATNYLEAMQGSTREGSSGGGSWLDIKDPEDERGRVGEGFPWQR
ncbi:unnamed protein product, partial [Laminaria digitata]